MVSAADPNEPAPRFAVVGYAARLPGSPDADAFWDLLREGRDAISEVPADRWNAEAFYDAEPGAPGKVATRRAGFVDDVTAVAINGDRATATVTYHFERSPEAKVTAPMVFTREGGEWKV